MIPLPIVVRELRVASRHRATYWMRSALAAGAFVVWLFLLMTGARMAGPQQMGPVLFNGIGIMALSFCLLAGVFLTADCLSQERREGTLGLLFLTDLKGYDVAGGKLMAMSLPAFSGVLTILPVLAVPLMMGGVTGGEFWRITLVLVTTLLWSLCLGLMVSAFTRETRQALSVTLLLVIVLAGLVPLAGCLPAWLARNPVTETWPFWCSPGYLYGRALDIYFKWGREEFWAALGTVGGTAALALAVAVLRLPHAWRETGAGATGLEASHWRQRWRFGGAGYREARRGLLERSPFHWLAGRDRRPRWGASLTAGVLLLLCSYFYIRCFGGERGYFEFYFNFCLLTAFAMHLVLKWQVAVEASRVFSEARRSGSMELLLVTPIKVTQILEGQRAALWDTFALPLAMTLLTNLSLVFMVLGPNPMHINGRALALLCEMLIGGVVLTLADFHALGWVGMWLSLRKKHHHRAILGTVGRVLVLPWVGILFLWFLAISGAFRSQEGFMVLLFFWYGCSLALDIGLVGWARAGLITGLRHVSAEPDATMSVRQSVSLEE